MTSTSQQVLYKSENNTRTEGRFLNHHNFITCIDSGGIYAVVYCCRESTVYFLDLILKITLNGIVHITLKAIVLQRFKFIDLIFIGVNGPLFCQQLFLWLFLLLKSCHLRLGAVSWALGQFMIAFPGGPKGAPKVPERNRPHLLALMDHKKLSPV